MPNIPDPKTLTMGVYRVFDSADPEGPCYMGFSRNVEGTIKRLRFELTLNACSYKPLQLFYLKCTSPEIALHAVYTPDGDLDDMSDVEIDAHLYAMLLSAKTKLPGEVHFIQTPGALNI